MTRRNKYLSDKNEVGPRTPHTNNEQRLLIINWLKVKENFAMITKSAIQGEKKFRKIDAYKELAKYVSEGSKIPWDAKQTKSRYEGYFNTYKKTKHAAGCTGWGITDDDRGLGITTIEEKLEDMCPNFAAMDALFADSQDAKQIDTQESGLMIPTTKRIDIQEKNPIISSTNPIDIQESDRMTPLTKQIDTAESDLTISLSGDDDIDIARPFLEPVQSSTAFLGTSNSKKRLASFERDSVSFGPLRHKEFSSVYTESSCKQIELDRAAFDFNKAFKEAELQIQRERLLFDQTKAKQDQRTELIKTLIHQGKTAQEINDYLAILKI
ncbi:hypothetical protein HDV02_002049 [Globomyces sp. JEL0801]|nr:hypothetical protein HDV02_002049 [Globomyces sp. JEL0801]